MKFLVLIAALAMPSLSYAGDRLICAGGNIHWGGGIFELKFEQGQCQETLYNGYDGIRLTDNTIVASTAPVSTYNARVNCRNYQSNVKTDAKGAYALIGYPGISHGGIEPSGERIPCKWNPNLPASLMGLKVDDIIKAVSVP